MIKHDGKTIVARSHGGADLCKKYHGDKLVWVKNIERRLPMEYQEVEYLESNGKQGITTNIYSNQDTVVRIDFENTLPENNFLVGGRNGQSSKNCLDAFISSSSSLTADFASSLSRRITASISLGRHIVTITKDKVTLDNKSISFTTSLNSFVSEVPLCIAYSKNFLLGDNKPMKGLVGKVYACVVYQGDNCVGNFVPCYRKSDHKSGMYDTITNTFFTSETSTDFFVGADVKCSKLEYIESKGDQYINLHLIPKTTHSFSTKVKITDKSIANNMIIGSRTTGTYQSSNDQIYMNWQKVDKRIVLRNRFNSNVIYFNEGADGFFNLTKVKNENCQLENPEIPYFVFALNKLGEPDAFACCQIYFFEIYDNDVLKMNLIPYKIGDIAGLLDTVSKVFFIGELVGKPFATKEPRRR